MSAYQDFSNSLFFDAIDNPSAVRKIYSLLTGLPNNFKTQYSHSKQLLMRRFSCSPAMTFNCRIDVIPVNATLLFPLFMPMTILRESLLMKALEKLASAVSTVLWSYVSCTTPYIDVNFKFDDKTFFYKPAFESPEIVTVRYWDLYDWTITKKLFEYYSNQFGVDGLLSEDYQNKLCVTIQFASFKRTYFNVVLDKPMPAEASSGNHLLTFTLKFSYRDYVEEFLEDAFPLFPVENSNLIMPYPTGGVEASYERDPSIANVAEAAIATL